MLGFEDVVLLVLYWVFVCVGGYSWWCMKKCLIVVIYLCFYLCSLLLCVGVCIDIGVLVCWFCV